MRFTKGVPAVLSNFTFGQYYRADSVIHRMDPRFKLPELIAIIVFIFVCRGFGTLAIMAALVLAVLLLSRVPLKFYFKNLKALLPILILTALLNMFYVQESTVLFRFWVFTVSTGGIYRAGFMAVRVVLLILISSVLTYTTTPTELTDAIESLLSPLKLIGLGEPVHILAMMMTIALRFIPTLTDETDKILSAQRARGANTESGGLIKKMKAMVPVLIPLLISSVRRAGELAEAMDCRCYNGGKGRTRMKKIVAGRRDFLSLFLLAVVFSSIIILQIIF